MYRFNFTPENLLDNLDKLGGWSMYGLAETAIKKHFGSFRRERPVDEIALQSDLTDACGFKDWTPWIIWYHLTYGYTKKELSSEGAVNQY